MKKHSLIFLGLIVLIQLAVPYSLIQKKEKIMQEGNICRFLIRPIDPADPFQGRYVRLAYLHDYIPWQEDAELDVSYKGRMYAIIETGEDGFDRFTGWSLERPTGGTYLETRYLGGYVQWHQYPEHGSTYKGLRIDIPFDRFYMDEAKAPRAEGLARTATRSTNCWASVRILNGKAVIEDVFAEGRSLRDRTREKE